MSKFRAGVVGLGWAGQQHQDAYANHPDVELVALAGQEPELLDRLGDTHGVASELRFAGYEEMLAGADLDVVSIAAPTSLHAPMAIAALDAGVHVLSEKPLAENGERGSAMVAAAKANDRVLDVSFNHRRRGDVKALRRLVADGVLGEVYHAKAGWLRRNGIPGLGTWFTRAATSGGGPLMDIGIHMLDAALHLLGEPAVEAVSAATYAEFGPRGRGGMADSLRVTRPVVGADGRIPFEVEDLATSFVRLAGGAALLLETSWAQYVERDVFYVTLYGSEGGAVLGAAPDWRTPQLRVFTDVDGVPAELSPPLPPDGHHAEAVGDFVAKVQAPDHAPYRGEEYLTRALVVDAAYRSAKENREVRL